jgi:hypothetical protein
MGTVARAHWGEAMGQLALLRHAQGLGEREVAATIANIAVFWTVTGVAIGSAIACLVDLARLARPALLPSGGEEPAQ